MSNIQTVTLSSLYRVLPEIDPSAHTRHTFSCMKNEPLSFQIAYKLCDGVSFPFYVTVLSDLPLALYGEGAVPVPTINQPQLRDTSRDGVFYDMLLQKTVNPPLTAMHYPWQTFWYDGDKLQLHAVHSSWKALWLTVNEDGKTVTSGVHTVTVQFYSRDTRELAGECTVTIDVIDAALPRQSLLYTNWFHCDCLCDTYGVPMFSERFFEIFRSFVSVAAKHGMNLLLTPCFTPPLDTSIGGERQTAQLVGVEVQDGDYHFDFSLLERFVDEARACGIRYFEHSHLFTQWGAKHAPKIMATVNGKTKQLFGWKTKASGAAYRRFLRAYLTQLLAFLKEKGIDRRFFFHFSDEPSDEMLENYRLAKDGIADLLDGYMCGDAISHYEVFEKADISHPIVATNFLDDFKGKCKNLWAYYTGEQCTDGMSNRKLNCFPERNRMVGLSLYAYRIKGFLHWGYNYYYDMLSCGVFDPKTDPCFYGGSHPATSFCVYPATDGTCIPSIRQKVFYEALNDMRALQLLERKIGRKAAMAFLKQHYGDVDFHTPVESADKLLAFREALNREIQKHTKGD